MTGAIGERIARAGAWAIGGKLGARVIDFASLLVLAQLLLPADFGLVAMAMTVILLIEAVTEVPLIEPILRSKDPTPDFYDTSFTLGLVRGAGLALVVLCIAWPAAAYYNEPRLPGLLAALMLAPILRSLASPRMADFIRVYDKRADFKVTILAKTGAFAAILLVAMTTGSYWAIVIGTIIGPALASLLTYLWAPYHPRLSLARWSDFADVVGWNSLTQFFQALNFQIDRILLGRTLPVADLGRYSLASDLTGVPFQGILFPFFSLLGAAFARAETEEALQQAWAKALNGVLFMMGPVLLGLTMLAGPIVHSLLGDTWADMRPILAALALTSLPGVLGHLLAPLAVATYRARLVTFRAVLELVVNIPLTVAGIAWFGLWGAVASRGIAGLVGMGFAVYSAGQITGLGPWQQVTAIWRTLLAIAVFTLVTYLLCPAIDIAPMTGAGRVWLGLEVLAVFSVALVTQTITTLISWVLAGRPSGFETILMEKLVRMVRR